MLVSHPLLAAQPGDNILDNPLDNAPRQEQEYIPLDDELSDQMNAPESIPMQEGQGIDVLADPLVEEQGVIVLEAQAGDIQPGPSGQVTTDSNGNLVIEFDDGTVVTDNGPAISHEEAFNVANRWVGSDSYEYPPNSDNHYSQTQPDGTVHRFRMTDSDINAVSGEHINLEIGRWLQNRHGDWYFEVTQNIHVRIQP